MLVIFYYDIEDQPCHFPTEVNFSVCSGSSRSSSLSSVHFLPGLSVSKNTPSFCSTGHFSRLTENHLCCGVKHTPSHLHQRFVCPIKPLTPESSLNATTCCPRLLYVRITRGKYTLADWLRFTCVGFKPCASSWAFSFFYFTFTEHFSHFWLMRTTNLVGKICFIYRNLSISPLNSFDKCILYYRYKI